MATNTISQITPDVETIEVVFTVNPGGIEIPILVPRQESGRSMRPDQVVMIALSELGNLFQSLHSEVATAIATRNAAGI